jgi:hypothetical protein
MSWMSGPCLSTDDVTVIERVTPSPRGDQHTTVFLVEATVDTTAEAAAPLTPDDDASSCLPANGRYPKR